VEWKLWVRRRLEEEEISLAELARRSKCSRAAISQLLGPEDEAPIETSTKLMPAINKALGAAAPRTHEPEPEQIDDAKARIDRAWPALDQESRQIVDALVRKLTPQG
jgi:transcriptional regulator with XRE-family HTH domain